jgi:Trk K+ transport system NAD-binding subunit
VKQQEGPIQFNPQASYVLRPEDVLIVLGRTEDIEQFRAA